MGCRSPNPKTISTPLTNAGQGLRHRIGMAQKKQRSRLSPRPLCVIEPVLHQHQSNGSWYAIPQENGNHKRSSAPPLIRIQPKSARTLQCDGKWRSHFRRRTPAAELKLNASGPKKRSREPHQYCSAFTVWFVSGRSKPWKQIRCHMLQRSKNRPSIHSPMQLLGSAVKSFCHTPRYAESVTKIHLANSCAY